MTSIADRIAALPTIALEELLALAALMERTDRKYVVTEAQFGAFIDALDGRVRVLEVNGRRKAAYESVYFDTDDRLSFTSAARGRRRRFKVRTRSYLDMGQSFIEVKLRSARRQTLKVREPVPFEERGVLGAAARAFVRRIFTEHGIEPDIVDALHPVLRNTFHRTTLFVPTASCRITVDTDVMLADATETDARLAHLIILETKSGTGDRSVDRLLWRMGCRPQTVSKFAIGSVLLDATLPDNKWRRTMERHVPTQQAEE